MSSIPTFNSAEDRAVLYKVVELIGLQNLTIIDLIHTEANRELDKFTFSELFGIKPAIGIYEYIKKMPDDKRDLISEIKLPIFALKNYNDVQYWQQILKNPDRLKPSFLDPTKSFSHTKLSNEFHAGITVINKSLYRIITTLLCMPIYLEILLQMDKVVIELFRDNIMSEGESMFDTNVPLFTLNGRNNRHFWKYLTSANSNQLNKELSNLKACAWLMMCQESS